MINREFKNMKLITKLVYLVATIALLNWFTFKVYNYNFLDQLLILLNLTAYSNWLYWIIGAFGVYAVYKIFK